MPQTIADGKNQELLIGALASLLQAKPFDAITVTDITRTAKVGRTTFYSYYQDKYDLIEHLENTHIEAFCELLTASRRDTPRAYLNNLREPQAYYLTCFYTYVQQNIGVLSVLFSPSHNTNFMHRMDDAVARHRRETLRMWGIGNPTQFYWGRALAGVHLTLTRAFIRQSPALSPEEMSEIATGIFRSLLAGILAPESVQLPPE